jgi:hypothetical protein
MLHKAISRTMVGSMFALCAGCGSQEDRSDDAGLDTDAASSGVQDDAGEASGVDGNDDDDDDQEDPSVVCDGLVFDNVVDAAACPSIQGLGVDPEPADQVEFCRRAYVDLLGEAPTRSEYAHDCQWWTFEEIVDDFMARPEYVRTSQRMWADVFHSNSAVTHWAYIDELDALAGELHMGLLGLDEFAEIAVTHPAFTGRWDGVDLVGFAFLAFLGRDANPAERLALEPLWHLWGERPAADPFQSNAKAVVLDTLRCVAPNESACHSDHWGDHTVMVEPAVPGDVDPNGPNVVDQAMLTDEQWMVLRTPGRLITQQPQFYEAYVDRALRRYLGYDAGGALPKVRQALVDLMVEGGGNVLEVDREILTSGLYVSTNRHEEAPSPNASDWDPHYWHGPVKQMDAENWLATAAKLTGLALGHCDHRYPQVQSGSQGFHPHEYPTLGEGSAPDYTFRDMAQLLGGCPDRVASFRETRTGLIAALTQATLTTELCDAADASSPIYPLQFVEDPSDKSTTALHTAAGQVYEAALVRPIPEGATAALAQGIEGCRDELSCTPQEFAIQTCRLVLKSADFFYY